MQGAKFHQRSSLLFLILILLGSGIFSKNSQAAGWHDAAWKYRRVITIDNTSNASSSTNYPVRIQFTPANFNYSYTSSTGADIRFTDSDGVTTLNYWMESWDNTATSTFWVKVPSIPASATTTIYLYYGNSNATSASNGNKTFEFFDDFEGGSLFPPIFGIFKGKPWTRHESNPILTKSPSGWDSYGVRDAMLMLDARGNLVKEDNKYVMYYRGNEYDPNFNEMADHIKRQIGRATSIDGINWVKDEANNPVLELGRPGKWDDSFIGSAWVIKLGENDYMLYYDGYDGLKSGIGRATSIDGMHWTKYADNPILTAKDWVGISSSTVMAIISAIKTSSGDYAIFFETGIPSKAIFGAISDDGIKFKALNEGQAILTGTANEWDYMQVANPKVIEIKPGKYIMGYNGRGAIHQQLGFAYSTDLVHWEKYRENPVMFLGNLGSWDDSRIENAFIAKDDVGNDSVRMWYFGCPTNDAIADCAIGYAVSDQNTLVGPLGWWAVGGDPEISSEQFHSSVNSIKIDTGDREYIRRAQNHVGNFVLVFYQNYETNAGRSNTIRIIDGPGARFYMKYEDGHLHYKQNNIWVDLGAFDVDVWHRIEAAVNTVTNKVKIFVDNSYIGEYEPSHGIISGLTYLDILGASANAYYTDDVFVRKYFEPEPAVSIGREIRFKPGPRG